MYKYVRMTIDNAGLVFHSFTESGVQRIQIESIFNYKKNIGVVREQHSPINFRVEMQNFNVEINITNIEE